MKVKKSPYSVKLADISKRSSVGLNYRVRKAIYESLQNGWSIDISNISFLAGVERQTIYNNQELRALIEYYKEYCQGRLEYYKGETKKDTKKKNGKFRFLMGLPSLQGMEPVMDELIEENHKLHMQYLDLQTKVFALENGIEVEN